MDFALARIGRPACRAGFDPRRSAPGRFRRGPAAWLRNVSAWLRAGLGDNAEARSSTPQSVRLRHLLAVLERQPDKKAMFAASLRAALGHRDAFDLLIETGMPREAGFLGEFTNRVFARILPEPPAADLASLFVQVFPEREDAELVAGVSAENWSGVLAMLDHGEGAAEFRAALAKASTRAVASLAVQVCAATHAFAGAPADAARRGAERSRRGRCRWRRRDSWTPASRATAARRTEKAEALRALVGRALIEVDQAYTHLDDQGVSITVVYQLERIRAQLQRAGELTELLASPEHLPQVLPHFIASLVRDVHDHRSALALAAPELRAGRAQGRGAQRGDRRALHHPRPRGIRGAW